MRPSSSTFGLSALTGDKLAQQVVTSQYVETLDVLETSRPRRNETTFWSIMATTAGAIDRPAKLEKVS